MQRQLQVRAAWPTSQTAVSKIHDCTQSPLRPQHSLTKSRGERAAQPLQHGLTAVACQIITQIAARGTDAWHLPSLSLLSQGVLPVFSISILSCLPSSVAAQWLPCLSLRMLPGCRKKALSRAAAIPVLISRLGAEEPETCWHAVAALRHMSALPDVRVSPLVGDLSMLACTVYTAHDFSSQAPAST